MASAYSITKRVYHSLIPAPVRDGVHRLMPSPLKRLKRWGLQKLAKNARHDDIYDEAYYQSIIEPTMESSAQIIAATIVEELKPRSVVDVGCGSGRLLEVVAQLGVSGLGLEYAEAGVALCRRRGLTVIQFDIEHHAFPNDSADLVISTEVAEHLPASCADRFVDLLCHLANQVVLTAAEPGVDGTDHVNEQPTQYWIAKFTARGYRFDQERSHRWRVAWRNQGVAHCFASTVMVFGKEGTAKS
jgi:SAM-dependent methyltransferase